MKGVSIIKIWYSGEAETSGRQENGPAGGGGPVLWG
jgi:hypothetical protein